MAHEGVAAMGVEGPARRAAVTAEEEAAWVVGRAWPPSSLTRQTCSTHVHSKVRTAVHGW